MAEGQQRPHDSAQGYSSVHDLLRQIRSTIPSDPKLDQRLSFNLRGGSYSIAAYPVHGALHIGTHGTLSATPPRRTQCLHPKRWRMLSSSIGF